MQQIPLQVDDEIKAAADAIALVASMSKGGKSIAEITAAALPVLLSALPGLGQMGADIKKVDNQTYIAYALAKALEG